MKWMEKKKKDEKNLVYSKIPTFFSSNLRQFAKSKILFVDITNQVDRRKNVL